VAFEMVEVGNINTHSGTQTRVGMDGETVKRYAEALKGGATRPETDPVVVFHDGNVYWLASGFHWVAAARLSKIGQLRCEVRKGTKRDAILFSASCNETHGLPLTVEDRRNKVRMILEDKEWAKKSVAWVAAVCRVSDGFAAKVKEEMGLASNGETLQGRDGKFRRGQKDHPGKKQKKGQRRPTTRSGSMKFDWRHLESNYGNLIRQIDAMGNAFGTKDTPEAQGLRRKLAEWLKDIKAWYRKISRQKPPEGE
jgi:hypothetical protein